MTHADPCECDQPGDPAAGPVCQRCGRPMPTPESIDTNTRSFHLRYPTAVPPSAVEPPHDPPGTTGPIQPPDVPPDPAHAATASQTHVVKLERRKPLPPPDVPGYEILGELGRGGMGVVYQAREKALHRTVALKMILAGAHAAAADRERFRKEAEAVAALQHPNIVQIFHVDEHAGQPFLVLEYVDGGSLAQRIATGDLLTDHDAAELIERLARAMQYAHDRGVIHRDLKPANILLSAERGTRSSEWKTDTPSPSSALPLPHSALAPKVSDFGLAKRIDETLDAGGATRTGAVMGTPSYISPEQASGKSAVVTAAADVYSLGAILYELLTGRPPFRADTPVETVMQVIHDDPVPPYRLRPKVARDLETVCLKCLSKDPRQRYATAAALADDLARYRAGEPILARPQSPLALAGKWARRNPAIASFAATAAAALVGLLVVLAIAYSRVSFERGQKEREADTARREKDEADRLRRESDQLARDRQDALDEVKEQADELEKRDEQNRRTLYSLQLSQVAGLYEKDPARALRLLDDPARCPEHLRDFTWRYLRRLCAREEREYRQHARPIRAAAVSPDGLLVATADDGGTVRLWSPLTRVTFATLAAPGGPVGGVAFAPDGGAVAAACGDGAVRLWSLPPSLLELVRTTSAVLPKTQYELNKWVPGGLARALSLRPAAVISAFAHRARCVAFSPDGRLLAAGGSDKEAAGGQGDGAAKVWDVTGFEVRGSLGGLVGSAAAANHCLRARGPDGSPAKPVMAVGGHFRPVLCVAFAPDGLTLATGGEDAGVQLTAVADGGRDESLRQHGGPVWAVAFSPDGRTLATTDNPADQPAVVLWDVANKARRPTEKAKLVGHALPVRGVAFASDGRTLATIAGEGGFQDPFVRLWDVEAAGERARLGGVREGLTAVAFLPDRKELVTAADDGVARVWQTGVRLCDTAYLDPDGGPKVLHAAVSPSGKVLATADATGAIRLWGIDRLFADGDGELPRLLASGKDQRDLEWRINGLAVSEVGGLRVAAATTSGVLDWDLRGAWDPASPAPVPVKRLGEGAADAVKFAPDGGTLYALTAGSGVRAWDAATGRDATTPAMAAVTTPALRGRAFAVSPDGTRLAVAAVNVEPPSKARVLGLLVLDRGRPHFFEVGQVRAVEFAPDGRTLAIVTGGQRVLVRELHADGDALELKAVCEATGFAFDAAFTRDGRTLLTTGTNREVRAVDPHTGQERAALAGHADRIVGLGLAARDAALVTVGPDGAVKRWQADWPTDKPAVRPPQPPAGSGRRPRG